MLISANQGRSRQLAFGRMAELDGEKLVRIVYLDEGGISQYEPIVVVAGVMVDADKQLIRIEDHLISLKKKHIPEKDWNRFKAFSAKDIWSGAKYFKDKEKWPLQKDLIYLKT